MKRIWTFASFAIAAATFVAGLCLLCSTAKADEDVEILLFAGSWNVDYPTQDVPVDVYFRESLPNGLTHWTITIEYDNSKISPDHFQVDEAFEGHFGIAENQAAERDQTCSYNCHSNPHSWVVQAVCVGQNQACQGNGVNAPDWSYLGTFWFDTADPGYSGFGTLVKFACGGVGLPPLELIVNGNNYGYGTSGFGIYNDCLLVRDEEGHGYPECCDTPYRPECNSKPGQNVIASECPWELVPPKSTSVQEQTWDGLKRLYR